MSIRKPIKITPELEDQDTGIMHVHRGNTYIGNIQYWDTKRPPFFVSASVPLGVPTFTIEELETISEKMKELRDKD